VRFGRGVAYYVYMLASGSHGTLYLASPTIWCAGLGASVPCGARLTRRYEVDRLVWFESHNDITVAIQREKTLKR
jgi:putative endonuclease